MSSRPRLSLAALPTALRNEIDRRCDRFEADWQAGLAPRIEDYWQGLDEAARPAALEQLLLVDVECRSRLGLARPASDYYASFPAHASLIDAALAASLVERSTSRINSDDSAAGDASCEAVASHHDLPGRIGRYTILERLGGGGFGTVYRAHDPQLDRQVALKVPCFAFPGPEQLERFFAEARAAAQLQHPNIVRVYESGRSEQGCYIASELIGGVSLRKARPSGYRWTDRQAAELGARLARALDYAHQRQIVHRDVKPENILLTAHNEPHLADFGLARRLEGDTQHTQDGMQLGTPPYMSPEQAGGQSRQADGQSDQWSLGVVLYELLAGKKPFEQSGRVLTDAILSQEPPRLRKVIPSAAHDLETIVHKCLAKRPADRYPTCGSLADDLERFLRGEPIVARPLGLLPRCWRWARRKPLAAALLATAATALVAVTTAAWWMRQASRAQQLVEIDRLVERRLERPRLTKAYLDQSAALLAPYAESAPAEVRRAKERIYKVFAALIDARFREPWLEPSDFQQLTASIALLEEQRFPLAEQLRQRALRRQGAWQTILDIKRPFADWQLAFDPRTIELRENQLTLAAPLPAAESPSRLVFTNAKCLGNVRIEAIFAGAWETAGELGVCLNRAESRGYDLTLRVIPRSAENGDRTRNTPTVQATRQGNAALQLQISRDGSVLQRREVSLARIPPGPLRVWAARQRGEVVLRVGSLEPLRAVDPFPPLGAVAGVFAVRLAPGVGLVQLVAERESLPDDSTPLEQADLLLDDGHVAEALQQYTAQATHSLPAAVRQEVAYKQAICLVGLQRHEEASAKLEQLAAEPGNRWPLLSACRLWLLRLEANERSQADVVMARISARFDPAELLTRVPAHARDEILRRYLNTVPTLVEVLQSDAENVRRLEQTVVAVRLLSGDPGQIVDAELRLAQALQLAGRQGESPALVLDLARRYPASGGTLRYVVRLLRLSGDLDGAWLRASHALAHAEMADVKNIALLERARVSAARRDWPAVEQDCAQAIVEQPPDADVNLVDALLMQGFARLQRGDRPAARQTWQAGYRQVRSRAIARLQYTPGAGLRLVILGALADEMTDAEAVQIIDALLRDSGQSSQVRALKAALPASKQAALARRMWFTARGLALAQELAFDAMPIHERVRQPAVLAAYQVFRDGAFSGHLTKAQDEVIWQFSEQLFAAVFHEQRLDATQLSQLALAWSGVGGTVGWNLLAAQLPTKLRADTAYVLAHRSRSSGRQADARELLARALRDAVPQGRLARLAESDRHMLETNQGWLILQNDYPIEVRVLTQPDGRTLRVAPGERIEVAVPARTVRLELPADQADLVLSPPSAKVPEGGAAEAVLRP